MSENKKMEESKKACTCEHCAKRMQEDQENEEMNFAVLIALVPLLTMTLFSNMGMF